MTTFHGVIGAPVTPFTSDDRLDLDALEALCDRMVSAGVHGIALPLHTGESLNMTADERRLAVERAMAAVSGRVPVLVHVSTPGTKQAIELAAHAERAGAAAVIAVTPYHWRPSERALAEHFRAIARSVSIGVFAYNFPARLGVSVTAELIEELIDSCPNFVGVKDASYDMQSFTEACRRAAVRRPRLRDADRCRVPVAVHGRWRQGMLLAGVLYRAGAGARAVRRVCDSGLRACERIAASRIRALAPVAGVWLPGLGQGSAQAAGVAGRGRPASPAGPWP